MPLINLDKALRDVKNEVGLNLEDLDLDTNSRLVRYIKQGAAYLEQIAGGELDFEKDHTAYGLLVDYCRYANSQLTELFETNFQTALALLNADYQVKRRLGGDGGDD